METEYLVIKIDGMRNIDKKVTKNDDERFLNFHYQEIKDLCKQFLTLVSGILVLTLTFSEKIISINTASPKLKYLLCLSWSMFILSIIFNGVGLMFIFWAGDCANNSIIFNFDKDYKRLARLAYMLLGISGGFFVMGLVWLVYLLFAKLMS